MTRRVRKRRPLDDKQHHLVLPEPEQRFAALQRQRARLLDQIGKKKQELKRLAARVEAAIVEIRAAMDPLLEQRQQLEEELHALFAELLEPRRLAKRKQREVRKLYLALQDEGLITPRRVESADAFDSGEEDFHGSFDDSRFDDAFGGAGASGAAQRRGGYSADKPSSGGRNHSLRALFKRLVVALHPDRAQQEDEKVRRTEAMKEVTRAYESGDLARLLELEGHWASQQAVTPRSDDPSRLMEVLERTIGELKRQLQDVLTELRQLRRSEPFRALKQLERSRSGSSDPLKDFVAEAQWCLDQLRTMRDFVAAFSEGKMSWAEFIGGPTPSPPPGEEDEYTTDDLLDALLAELEVVQAPARRRRKSRKTKASAVPF